jgi:hypothetical protein
MSGTGDDPLPGFPAIGQYELVAEPGEPGYEEPGAVAEAGDEEGGGEGDGGEEVDIIDADSDDPYDGEED